jgi:O-antigen/teichoic acid export membrane protein
VTPIALSVLPSFLVSTVTVGLIFAHGGKFTLWLSIISGSVCVVVNYMLIGFFGYIGAGYALLISQGLTAIIGICFLKRLGLMEMIDVKSTLTSFLTASGLSASVSLLRPFPALRVLILIIPAVRLLNSLFGLKHLVYEKGLTA